VAWQVVRIRVAFANELPDDSTARHMHELGAFLQLLVDSCPMIWGDATGRLSVARAVRSEPALHYVDQVVLDELRAALP
jgi:hypothetical protein